MTTYVALNVVVIIHGFGPAKRLSGLPTYRENPRAETLQAFQMLGADHSYIQRYAEFRRDIVYGDTAEAAR